MKHAFLIILLISSIFTRFFAGAQPVFTTSPLYSQYTKGKNGLSSNVIFRVNQDPYGFLWLATDRGIQIYDGKHFTSYTLPGNDQEVVVTWRKDNYLLCFTYSGNIINIDMLSRRATLFENTDTAVNSKINHTPFILCHQIKDSVYLLNSSGAFVAVHENQINKTRNASINNAWRENRVFFHKILADNKSAPHISELLEAFGSTVHEIKLNKGCMVIRNRVFKLDDQLKMTLLFDAGDVGLHNEVINDFEINGNDLWVGYFNGNGVVRYRNYFKTANKSTLKPDLQVAGLPITSITHDGTGCVWVATLGNGLLQFNSADSSIRYLACNKPQFYSPNIAWIKSAGNGLITGYQQAVADIHYPDGRRQRIIADTIVKNNPVYYVSKQSGINLITQRAQYALDEDGKLKSMVAEVVKDAYEQDGFTYLSIKAKYKILKDDSVVYAAVPIFANVTMAPAFNGSQFYFGTTYGIYKGNEKVCALGNERILKVRQYNGTLLAATTSGLFIIKPGKKPVFLNAGNGLPGNYCLQLEQNGSNYYALSYGGLSVIDTGTLAITRVYSAENISPKADINCFSVDEYKIWMGTTDGIIIADKIHNRIMAPPRVYIRVADTSAPQFITERTTRPYGNKQPLFFQVDVLDYTKSPVNLKYYIEDEDGNSVTTPVLLSVPSFSVSGLWPGLYHIYVKVESPQNGWNITQHHTLVITPLWWQYTIVQTLLVAVAALAIFLLTRLIIQRRSRIVQRKLQQQNDILQLQSRLIFSQLKPHFIFNALNPLQPLIIKNETKEALSYVEQFSKLMRNMINLWRTDYVDLKTELTFLNQYIYIQRKRFSTAFDFIIDMPAGEEHSYEKLVIPSMLIQPLIENAVEHGIRSAMPCNHYIKLAFRKDAPSGTLFISVFNTGHKLPEPFVPASNHALFMIIERIELMKRETGIGQIACYNTDDGVAIDITIPLNTRPKNTPS